MITFNLLKRKVCQNPNIYMSNHILIFISNESKINKINRYQLINEISMIK